MDQKSALEINGRLSGLKQPLTMETARQLYKAAGLEFEPCIYTCSTDQSKLNKLQTKIKEAESDPNALIYLA